MFVEGPDDERFFAYFFKEHPVNLKFIQYANLLKERVNDFIKSIKSTPDCDYLFLGDGDGKTIDEKKEILLQHYPELEDNNIYIIQFEIESWYYAGLSRENHKKLKLKKYEFDTNTLKKEQFNLKLPRISDRIFIMGQILSLYSIDLAKRRNNSFCCFFETIFA